jgi:hypothetical protein
MAAAPATQSLKVGPILDPAFFISKTDLDLDTVRGYW